MNEDERKRLYIRERMHEAVEGLVGQPMNQSTLDAARCSITMALYDLMRARLIDSIPNFYLVQDGPQLMIPDNMDAYVKADTTGLNGDGI